jgi:hypothetical protein
MSRKKKKKRGRQRARPSFPARYGVGHHIRVKPGTTDPDFPDIPLGGWAGAIMDVDRRSNPPIYLIQWNQHTLDHMHPVYRKRCERDGLELESMWLGEKDIEPDNGGSAIIEQPTNIITRPLSKNAPEDRIRAIFGLTSDDPLPPANVENLRRYGSYLRSQLSFPFQGNYTVAIGPFEEAKYLITVLGTLDGNDCDEEEGVLCMAEQNGESFELPLADIEIPNHPHNRQLVEDYSYWFGNWPIDDFTAPAAALGVSFDTHTGQPGKWSFLRILALYGLYGAAYGIVLGSLVGALEDAMTGALVGAGILGLVGLAAGAGYGMLVGRLNRVRYASLAGGFFGALAGVVVGAVIGAMVAAYAGTLLGGIIGALVGRLLAKWKWRRLGSFEGTIIGAGVGAVVMAYCRDQEKALAWAFHGAWLGVCTAVFLVFAAVGSLALASRNRTDG